MLFNCYNYVLRICVILLCFYEVSVKMPKRISKFFKCIFECNSLFEKVLLS